MKLSINGCGLLLGRPAYKILIDGVDISDSVRQLVLTLSANTVDNATITFNVDHVDIDAEALAMLRIEVETKKGEENG